MDGVTGEVGKWQILHVKRTLRYKEQGGCLTKREHP